MLPVVQGPTQLKDTGSKIRLVLGEKSKQVNKDKTKEITVKKWEIESVTVSITLWAVGATVYLWAKQTVETTELAFFFFKGKYKSKYIS